MLQNRNNLFGGTLGENAYFMNMGEPEEISNIESFPLSPRMAHPPIPSTIRKESELPPAITKRSLTPAHKIQVEFWHQGEKAAESVSPVKSPPSNRSKMAHQRADQFGWIMGGLALIVITVIFISLHLSNRKYSYKDGFSKKSTTPIVDFYQGNIVFAKKVQQARGLEKSSSEDEMPAILGASEGMDISLKDQMASMNAKLEQVRAQKLNEEPAISMPEKLANPALHLEIKPVDPKKFENPLEFNGMLPKPLQQTN